MLVSNTLIFNRYLIKRLIGQGGMGTVYEAIDQRLGNTVALKQTLVVGHQLDKAFEHEAKLLAALRHQALPKVIDYFVDNTGQFLVMEFIPGDDFARLMTQRAAPFPADDVLRWANQLLDVLEYLHSRQPSIVHRDIKPQNLKPTADGHIVLLDFGLAKGTFGLQSQGKSNSSVFGFTRQYAPLEQIQSAGTDPRSDLYALAATLHHLLIGKPPVDALTRATAVLYHESDPLQTAHDLNSQVPTFISDALIHAMALNPNDRPSSAAVMRSALHAKHKAEVPRVSTQSTIVAGVASRQVKATNISSLPKIESTAETSPKDISKGRQQSETLPWGIILGVVSLLILIMLTGGLSSVFTIHQIFGERVLPLLIGLAAIWLTVTWKPDAPPNPVARLFPPLVGIQVLLGIIYWLYLLIGGNMLMLSFPFILHPLIGIIAAGVAQMAVKGGPFRRLGRWAPLAALLLLLVLVIVNVMLAKTV